MINVTRFLIHINADWQFIKCKIYGPINLLKLLFQFRLWLGDVPTAIMSSNEQKFSVHAEQISGFTLFVLNIHKLLNNKWDFCLLLCPSVGLGASGKLYERFRRNSSVDLRRNFMDFTTAEVFIALYFRDASVDDFKMFC